jgi:hypothetical protein
MKKDWYELYDFIIMWNFKSQLNLYKWYEYIICRAS